MAAFEIFKFHHVDAVIQLSGFHTAEPPLESLLQVVGKEALIIKPQILSVLYCKSTG